jgi:hypothetical protein
MKTLSRGCASKASLSRPVIERLEARIAPATFLVTTLSDSGAGSLRAAIDAANAALGADIIDFKDGGEVLLLSSLPTITDALTIKGLGSAKTTIDGNDAHRILNIASTARINVSISGVTLENGRSDSAALSRSTMPTGTC